MRKTLYLTVLVLTIFTNNLSNPKRIAAETKIPELQILIREAAELESEINKLEPLLGKIEEAAAKGKLEFPPDFEDEIYETQADLDNLPPDGTLKVNLDNIPSDSDSDSETDDDSEFTKPEEPKPEKK